MPKRNMVILAMLPIAALVLPFGTWPQRVTQAGIFVGVFVVAYLFSRWVRWHDARGAARYVARQSEQG